MRPANHTGVSTRRAARGYSTTEVARRPYGFRHHVRVRWLDLFIDYLHLSYADRAVGVRFDIGPFSRVGSMFNALVSVALGAITLWTGITGETTAYIGAVVAGVLAVTFVRVCVRAFRGDFDDFVLDPADLEETPT